MRKRRIIVPKNKSAELALDFDEASEEQLIELLLEEDGFLFLFQNGIIELINREGNTNIDDFEDDSVKGSDNIQKVIKALNSNNGLRNFAKNKLLKDISNLFAEAFHRQTGVYFYF